MSENELSVAAFYCQLFSTVQAVNGSEGGDEQRHDEAKPQTTSDVWVEDTWTEDDDAKAHGLLKYNQEKCIISPARKATDSNAWDQFYRDHGIKFFKDRHYLSRAFPLEFSPLSSAKVNKTLVEVGCGVGNAILPLMEDESSEWQILHGLDLSHVAIDLLRKDPRFIQYNNQQQEGRSAAAFAHVCDISLQLPSSCAEVADVTTLLFCLSALDPSSMPQAALHVASSLRPGGVLVVRDYGRYDEAQMKLGVSRNKQLKDNFYQKHDGTKVFYFTVEDLEQLFTNAGLKVLELEYIRRIYKNNASGEKRRRVWVQGRFSKPINNL
jgi:SAM-dependent methyltransferase